MANSSKKIIQKNLKKENEDGNENASQNEDEPIEESEQTDEDNISEAEDQESATENNTESESEKTNTNKKLKSIKNEIEETTEQTTTLSPEELDSDEESEEKSEKVDDENEQQDTKDIEEEDQLSQETTDNTANDDTEIDLLISKSETEVTEDCLIATGEFLYLLYDYYNIALEEADSEQDENKIQELINQIENLLSRFPPRSQITDFSVIDINKIQDFVDKYSELIKDYLAVQTQVLHTNLMSKKTEFMQQASVLAYKIATNLPDRDEVSENLRLAAAKLSYYCARYVITTSIKSFVKKLDYVPAIINLTKDFLRDTIQLIKDPSAMTTKLLSNYLNNIDNNMNKFSMIFGTAKNHFPTKSDAKKDIATIRTKKANNFADISTLAQKTFSSSEAILSLLSKKITNSVNQKNIPSKNSKQSMNSTNYGDKILKSREQTKNKVQTRG